MFKEYISLSKYPETIERKLLICSLERNKEYIGSKFQKSVRIHSKEMKNNKKNINENTEINAINKIKKLNSESKV